MKANGLYDYAATLFAIPAFHSDATFRADALKALRSAIRKGTVPDWITTALTSLQANFPAGTSLRCRSSTNNEDLTGYSGAGLYDSFTHYETEGHLSKTIRQVWASLWEDRAFDEREFYRVDHFRTAMGVLVHPNYDGELANGVGVTKNLVDPAWTGYYINAQAGENLVTNPENNAIPEEFLIAQLLGQSRYTLQYVTFSSLMPEGQTVISTPQAELLADQMAKIHNHFLPLYNYPPNFAMELEWKIDTAGKLVIKQARPWID
jgi:phosphoenolpyruvate synthase/pyruvate phosphate dikinase